MSEATVDQLLSYRRQVQGQVADSTKSFDTSVLAVSSGGLVVSVTALGILLQADIKPPIWPFLITWALFAIASLAVVLSHLAARKAQLRAVDAVDEYLREGRESDDALTDRITGDLFNKCVERLNSTSASTILLGVLFFITALAMTIDSVSEAASSSGDRGSGGSSTQSDTPSTRGNTTSKPPPSTGGGKGGGKGGK